VIKGGKSHPTHLEGKRVYSHRGKIRPKGEREGKFTAGKMEKNALKSLLDQVGKGASAYLSDDNMKRL